jgi:signal transduction histidine kinase
MVGQRMQQLVHFARQLGQGQLDNRLCLEGDDEIADLCLEMNQMAEQLQEAKQHLLAENEARIATVEQLRHTERLVTLGKLSSGLAHELGTPLNVISGRARLIENEDMEHDEVVENAAIICQQTERVTRIIRQMLDYARRTSPQRTKVNLRELIEQVVVILQHSARKQAVEIVVSGLLEKPPEIFIDYGQIQQVITNLLMNGLQAMPQGGRLEIRLAVGVYSPPAAGHYKPMPCAVIMVLDNGPGLEDEVMERAFEPFYTTKGVGQGTGLGPSIVREIVVEHGGWITAANIEGGTGACFAVYLPMEEGNDEAPHNDS